jgi:2-succinyl-6-hydroxy-2,4-cyclohexadiene-1-carboxylate synthase
VALLNLHFAGEGMPILLLHGFTQTRSSARRFREALQPAGQLITLDLPGHGEHATVRANLTDTANLIAEALPQSVAVVGYSLGGRVALHLACEHPELVSRLITIGASPGLPHADERQQRVARDQALAASLRQVDIAEFLDSWTTQPLFAGSDLDDDERASRESNTVAGLANSLIDAGTGTQEWLLPRLAALSIPSTFIAGARDERFVALARAMAEISGQRFQVVAAAGHAAHLDQPVECARLVREALA